MERERGSAFCVLFDVVMVTAARERERGSVIQ